VTSSDDVLGVEAELQAATETDVATRAKRPKEW
jgi:hypothetical protein